MPTEVSVNIIHTDQSNKFNVPIWGEIAPFYAYYLMIARSDLRVNSP